MAVLTPSAHRGVNFKSWSIDVTCTTHHSKHLPSSVLQMAINDLCHCMGVDFCSLLTVAGAATSPDPGLVFSMQPWAWLSAKRKTECQRKC
ncbi:hypothetical protein KIM372_12620 [Bombiscardovia nodaiensis]|uniref:Uncharacterized protein n=1 Tax=Bombiscardovia nodaiensis TaxID=2932181 RepID=A0ABM8B8Y7_9BIFI|nr:hypothetical protein KIM372_12620 [Bombiscardovia nodaiensis]